MPEQKLHNPADPNAPPAPPRALTAHASARAWREPSVRFWWVTGVVLLLIAIYLAVSNVQTWRHETRLTTEGLTVDATVDAIDSLAVVGAQRPVDSYIAITYVVAGQTFKAQGPPARPRAMVTIGQTIPIRVDPHNPHVWTARLEPVPLTSKFIGPTIALGIMALTLPVAWQRRRRVTRIWQEGAVRPATIVKVYQSGFAPLSHAADCSLSDTRDKRVYTVYLPQRAARPRAGEPIWLIIHPRWPRHALAVGAFEPEKHSGGQGSASSSATAAS